MIGNILYVLHEKKIKSTEELISLAVTSVRGPSGSTYPSKVSLQRTTTSRVVKAISTLIVTGSVKLDHPKKWLLWLRMAGHVTKPPPCVR